MKKICDRCGTEYEAQREVSRYCSPTCRQYAYLERHGLGVKNTGTVNDGTGAASVIEDKKVPPAIEERKQEENQTVKTPVDVNVLAQLMEEIRQLKAQNERIISEQKQFQQNPLSGTPTANDSSTQDLNRTFSELLSLRMQELFGADMFHKGIYDHWSELGFKNANWVNERLKSHVKALLGMHKTNVDLSKIKVISEKIEELKKSSEFSNLPEDYPYINDINELSQRLKSLIDSAEDGDEIEFRIARHLRANLKAMVIEIGSTVPDVDHCPPKKKAGDIRQNRYYQKAKARGFDILDM